MTKIFIDGIMAEEPRQNAPEFVKGRISINLDKFYDSAQPHVSPKGWVNLDILESKKGGWYLQLNEWKPLVKPEGIPSTTKVEEDINVEDVPW